MGEVGEMEKIDIIVWAERPDEYISNALSPTRVTRVKIEGNADDRGAPDFNARLGLKRAENVRQVLIGHGATEKQITLKTLGESQPKLKGRDEESWAENRRADVVYEKEE